MSLAIYRKVRARHSTVAEIIASINILHDLSRYHMRAKRVHSSQKNSLLSLSPTPSWVGWEGPALVFGWTVALENGVVET